MDVFRDDVLTITRGIPAGSIMTYSQVAELLGVFRGYYGVNERSSVTSLSRSAGLPWWRILDDSGDISIPPHLTEERRLRLEAEGIAVPDVGIIDTERYRIDRIVVKSRDDNTLLLAKFVEKREHAEFFLSGKLYANRLSYFANLEEDEQRLDSDEGVVLSEYEKLVLVPQSGPPVEVQLSRTLRGYVPAANLNVFCMTSFGEEAKTESEFLEELRITAPTCIELGKYAVVIPDATLFIQRIQEASRGAGFHCIARMVEYDDKLLFPSWVHAADPFDRVFHKSKRFAPQREFRIAIDTMTDGEDHLELDVGNMADLGFIAETKDFFGKPLEMLTKFMGDDEAAERESNGLTSRIELRGSGARSVETGR